MKKAFAFLLLLALFCNFVCSSYAATEQWSGAFKYKILSDNSAEITGYLGYKNAAIVIPEEFDGHVVSSIGDYAFMYASISSLTIDENVTNIGDGAFFGCDAEVVIINAKNIKIGQKAFSCCSKLDTFSLTANNVEICEYAFMYTEPLSTFTWQLADKDAQNTKTIIHDAGFFSSGIIDITIPGDELFIGEKAFSCCSSIQSMTALCKTISIGDYAFMYTAFESFSLPNAYAENPSQEIKDYGFFSCELKSFIIPMSIKKIGKQAFACSTELESVVIPSTVQSIDNSAFLFCDSSLVAKVVAGSPADAFCRKNGITREYVTDEEIIAMYSENQNQ